ncbi:hypothetical protein [Streptomyces sp. NPDC093591]|uniref:hypothetical protein n=1 Tax=Streptomyces sp. NPDC093591 TaxID=3366044 RepID=UPI00381ED163
MQDGQGEQQGGQREITTGKEAAGKRIDLRVAHCAVVGGGLIVRFKQFMDTAEVRDAMIRNV